MKRSILEAAAQQPLAGGELTLQQALVDQLVAEGLLRDYANQKGMIPAVPRHLRIYGITGKGRKALENGSV